ncbi:MAG: hypothetical protein JXA69_16095 [Phycisphaerae bacterium]|nr:hypothetical protein [Phycisphaerae bacterium]
MVNLDFDQARWDRTRETYRQWWAGTLDRPLIHLEMKGRDPGRAAPPLPAYEFASFYDLSIPADAIADRWLYDLECTHFLGDAFPSIRPNFGPGVIAALLGTELHNGDDTVWFHPKEPIESLDDLRFTFDPENVWFRRLCDVYRAAAERFEGLVQLGMTDLGGNLDVLASFRSSQSLLLDLYDAPQQVERLLWDVHAMWWRYFEAFNAIIQPAHPGYTAWTPIYSEKPYYILQSDFCYMISPPMFEQFVKPELVASCEKLAASFYHVDGLGQLAHLDSLLAIESLDGVQWVPGAGQPGITHWPEVYRKIRNAGKLIQFFTHQDDRGIASLDCLAQQLGSARGIIMIGHVPADQEAEALALLEKYGAA